MKRISGPLVLLLGLAMGCDATGPEPIQENVNVEQGNGTGEVPTEAEREMAEQASSGERTGEKANQDIESDVQGEIDDSIHE